MADDALQIQLLWESIADDLLDRSLKFPRHARYSIAERIDNLVLDVLEGLIVARYQRGRERRAALEDINLRLTRLRALLRLAHRRHYLGEKGYEFVSERIDEAGRMLGGWLRLAPGLVQANALPNEGEA